MLPILTIILEVGGRRLPTTWLKLQLQLATYALSKSRWFAFLKSALDCSARSQYPSSATDAVELTRDYVIKTNDLSWTCQWILAEVFQTLINLTQYVPLKATILLIKFVFINFTIALHCPPPKKSCLGLATSFPQQVSPDPIRVPFHGKNTLCFIKIGLACQKMHNFCRGKSNFQHEHLSPSIIPSNTNFP